MSGTRAPSAWTVQKVMSTWMEVREELLRLDPALADDDSALTEAMRAETEDADEIVVRLVRAKIEADMMTQAINVRMNELADRKKRWARWSEGNKATAERILEIMGWPTIRAPDCTISKGTSQGGVRITDPELVPDWLCKIERTPKLAEIGVELKAGREVEGAEKTNGSVYLRISRK
jgi:hypothetical protein